MKYDFDLSDLDFNYVRNSKHCILLLLGFLYCEKKKIGSEIKEFKKLARELLKDEEDFNQYWLFVYEALPKSNLKSDWKALKDNKVTFVREL